MRRCVSQTQQKSNIFMTTQTLILDRPKQFQLSRSNAVFRVFLIILGFVILLLIALTKAHTFGDFWTDPLALLYTLFVTTFELSRLAGAVFYKYTYSKILPEKNNVEYEPSISFVIPCKNEEKTIAKTIAKCFGSEYPPDKVEVIVINDGSTDNTIGVLESLKHVYKNLIVVDWKKNRGKRYGMAEGFRKSKGEIIVQLDSDSYVEPATLPHLIRLFKNPKIGAVCAHADPENADENLLTKMQTAYYFLSFRILKAAESTFLTVFCCSGCSSAYRKDIVMPILDMWLNERFLGLPVTWGDDRGLTNWVLKLGYHTIYTDEVQAYTIVPNNLKQFLKQQVRWKKGWFVNSIFASRFIYKREPFVAFTYFFPLIFVTLLTPFMAAKAFFYNTIFMHNPPFFYILGIFLVACIITVYYRHVAPENKYWPYIFVWSAINVIFLSFILFYALITIQNRKWGTR